MKLTTLTPEQIREAAEYLGVNRLSIGRYLLNELDELPMDSVVLFDWEQMPSFIRKVNNLSTSLHEATKNRPYKISVRKFRDGTPYEGKYQITKIARS